MGRLGGYLRTRKGQKVDKARFAEEIRQLVDPTELQKQRVADRLMGAKRLIEDVDRTSILLEQVKKQADQIRRRHPNCGPLVACCGAHAWAALSRVASVPRDLLGLRMRVDDHLPPWDTVVLQERHLGKQKGGVI